MAREDFTFLLSLICQAIQSEGTQPVLKIFLINIFKTSFLHFSLNEVINLDPGHIYYLGYLLFIIFVIPTHPSGSPGWQIAHLPQ